MYDMLVDMQLITCLPRVDNIKAIRNKKMIEINIMSSLSMYLLPLCSGPVFKDLSSALSPIFSIELLEPIMCKV